MDDGGPLSGATPQGAATAKERKSRLGAIGWVALAALTLALILGMSILQMPGPFLIGPMIAGIAVALHRGTAEIPKIPYDISQGVLACFVGGMLTPVTVTAFKHHYPAFLIAVMSTFLMSVLCGSWLARKRAVPIKTAIFGSFPGAAAVMIIMARSSGADGRMVAVMQYARLIVIAVSTALISYIYIGMAGGHPTHPSSPSTMAAGPLAGTLLFAALAGPAGSRVGITAGAFLLPLSIASLASASGLFSPTLPSWVTAPCFVLVGWSVGLQFDAAAFRAAIGALPRIMLGIVALMAGCAAGAVLLSAYTGADLMTAYLATRPGGMDAAVILAVGTHADVSFVASMQITRLICVILIGPAVAKLSKHWMTRAFDADHESVSTQAE